MIRILAVFAIVSLQYGASAQNKPSFVPQPVRMQMLPEKGFLLTAATSIITDSSWKAQAYYFQQEIASQTGLSLPVQFVTSMKKLVPGAIHLINDSIARQREEYYILQINEQTIKLIASDIRGVINGMQSFLQLLPLKAVSSIELPAIEILDYPRFAYRGMHLDVVRHIFPVVYIKKYIDYLTFHKFNTFHWHLTDDQGWRWEVSSYPKLNSIASWRDATLIGHFKDQPARYDGKRYGGFYTKAEIREILEYAAVRGITVIPELDIPGHSRAAIAAYPEFSTRPDTTWKVATTWGMYNRQNNVLAPNEATFTFLRTIFHELTELFPSSYIHLGGDECSKRWWKEDPATQAFMKKKGLKDETALQTYFIEQVAGYLKESGRKAIGWHEIAEGALDTTTLIMNWGDDSQALAAARKGFSLVMSPGKPFYFDHYQSKDPKDSLAIHGYNPLEAVYQYDPVPAAFHREGLAYKVIGGQANVWTEYMEYPTRVDYMIFPRMSAVSEALWTATENKNYPDFLKRLETTVIPRYQYWNSSWFSGYRKWGLRD
jgi:hexosaminidase